MEQAVIAAGDLAVSAQSQGTIDAIVIAASVGIGAGSWGTTLAGRTSSTRRRSSTTAST